MRSNTVHARAHDLQNSGKSRVGHNKNIKHLEKKLFKFLNSVSVSGKVPKIHNNSSNRTHTEYHHNGISGCKNFFKTLSDAPRSFSQKVRNWDNCLFYYDFKSKHEKKNHVGKQMKNKMVGIPENPFKASKYQIKHVNL